MRIQITIVFLLLGSFVVRIDALCCLKGLQEIDSRDREAAEQIARPRCSCLVDACERGDFGAFAQNYKTCSYCDKVPPGYDHRLRELWLEYNKLCRQSVSLERKKQCAQKMKAILLERLNKGLGYANGFFDLMSIGPATLIEIFLGVNDEQMIYFLFDKCMPDTKQFKSEDILALGQKFRMSMPREWEASLKTEYPKPVALLAFQYIEKAELMEEKEGRKTEGPKKYWTATI